MEPEVSLIGYKILPGSPVVVGDKEDSENYIWTIHVTHFALAEKSKPGRNVVKISKNDESKFVLGTLEKDRCEQFTADLMIRERVTLSTSGDSEVHLTGYLTTTELLAPEDDNDEEYEGAERALNIAEDALDGQEFEDEEDSEDYEEEGETSSGEEEEEDDSDPSDSEEKELRKEILRKLYKEAKRQGKGADASTEYEDAEEDNDNDDTDEQESEEGEEENDEDGAEIDEETDDDELEVDTALEKVTTSKKRAAAEKLAGQAKKKAKSDAAAPETIKLLKPDKNGKKVASSLEGDNKAWEAAIRVYLAKEGSSNLSTIGTAVKKPAGATGKLKKIVEESPRLALDSNGNVSLRK